LPYVFTEQGVSMLSAVLKSKTAIEISIKIIDSFVNMRRFISQNSLLFERINLLDEKQSNSEKKIDYILDAIESKSIQTKQGIFFEGEVFDAYIFISDILKEAKKSVILIDNYIDENTLLHLSSKVKNNIKIDILTKNISDSLILDLQKNNKQYTSIELHEFKDSHDRFLIIDDTIYHIGASIKDLGKKWFAFSILESRSFSLIKKVNAITGSQL